MRNHYHQRYNKLTTTTTKTAMTTTTTKTATIITEQKQKAVTVSSSSVPRPVLDRTITVRIQLRAETRLMARSYLGEATQIARREG
jgi:hypothetical protein